MLPSSLTNLKRRVADESCLYSSALMPTEGRHSQPSRALLRSAGQRFPSHLLTCKQQGLASAAHIRNIKQPDTLSHRLFDKATP